MTLKLLTVRRGASIAVVLLLVSAISRAGGGPLGIDHRWSLDDSGIWARHYQVSLEVGVAAFTAGGALWLGNERPLGHVLWQTLDSELLASAAAQGLKYGFGRARPAQGNDPNAWFKGGCCQSFPSGEVTLQASFVTPLIVNYHRDHPWVWALEALPLYDSVARLKAQQHWQTDVLAGWALGSGIGYWTTTFKTPLTVRWLPHGLTVGMQRSW